MGKGIRNIVFKLHRKDGTSIETHTPVAGDDSMVKWVAEQLAEANECGVTAHHMDSLICTVGNVQN